MFYVRIVNYDGSTVFYSGISLKEAQNLYCVYGRRHTCVFAMWGDIGGKPMNMFTKDMR